MALAIMALTITAVAVLSDGAVAAQPLAASTPGTPLPAHERAAALAQRDRAGAAARTGRAQTTRRSLVPRTSKRKAGLPAPAVPKALRSKVGLPAPAVPKALRRKAGLPAPAVPRALVRDKKRRAARTPRRARPAQRTQVTRAAVAEPRAVAGAAAAGTGSVQGTVTDSVTGLTLPGVCVYLYTAAGAYAGTGACTGGAGDFSIPDVAPGEYTVAVFDPAGTHPTTWYGNVTSQAAARTFAVVAGSVTSPIAVSVAELTGITGRVRDTATAGRVPGACIYANQTSGGTASYATCVSSTSDTYAITEMAAGAYDIAFVDPSGLHRTVRTTANVVANRTTTGVDGDMPQVTAIVGSLLDAANSAPVSNGCVMLYAPGGGYVSGSYRCTDTQGRFVIDGITPGNYLLAYYDPTARFQTFWFDAKPDQGAAAVVTVTADTITTVGAARVTTSGSATGVVRNANGTPAANVCVYADDMAGRYTGVGTCSDSSGRYTLAGLPTGQYKIAFYPPGSGDSTPYWYLQRSNELSATPITITGLQTTTLLDQTLTVADDSTPPGPVTNVTTTSANSTVQLRWTNPSDADFTGVTIRRAPGAVAPNSPTAGTAVAEATKPGTSFDDTNVTAGQTYSYALFAHDETPNYAPAATTTATVVATAGAQRECGTLGTSTTWSRATAPVYILDCNVTIAANVTLTIEPGTIIKGASGSGIVVQGSLVASGTVADRVVLTSIRDDAAGGDTNGDGGATGPARGDWSGITTNPVAGSAAPSVLINRASMKHVATAMTLSGAAVSVRNSTVDRASGDGINVISSVGVPTVTGNTVTNAAAAAIVVQGSNIDMGLLNANSGSGNGLNGVQLANDTVTVSSALPWTGNLIPVLTSGCNALTVPAGVTLTLGAGTIIKGQYSGCAFLSVQGSLIGNGTAASPVTFTSWRDDTIGGDTNGDGSATGPVKGDWGGISASPAGAGNPDPTVNLDRVTLRYATTGVSASQTRTTVTNSTIDRVNGDGVTVNSPVGVPTVTGNTVTNATGTAINIQSANIDMGLLNANSGSGNGLNGVQLANDTVTVSSALPWTGNLIPVLTSGCNALTVPAGVTLTLGAGTIIKGQYSGCAFLSVQGSLIGNGTAASPVTFTSWRDDTIGGDTNGDGSATGPVKGDWGGISASPAGAGNPDPTVNLDRVTLRYATTGVSASQTRTTVTNSTIDRVNGDGVTVNSPVGVPTVTGNTVTNATGTAINIQSANIDMGLLNANSGSGNGLNGVQLANDTVTVSSALPWTGNLIPVLTSGCNALTVPAGVTLTLGAGTIIKGQYSGCAFLSVQGSLIGNGTAASPVTFTSWRDDTIGGDTNGDGSATGPVKGDWGGISASPAGAGNPDPTVNLDRVTLRYATTGVSASQTRTTVTNSTIDRVNGDGVTVNSPVGVPTVTGNTVTNATGTAINIQSANIDMGLLNANSGSGNGLNGVQLANDTVTVSSALPWTGNLIPVLTSGCNALTVPAGVTLTLGAGTIIKGQYSGCAFLSVQGSLIGNGTAASPVTFTSWRDDTIGGDTNGDGSATGPVKGDWGGISASPAGAGNPDPTVNLDRVTLRYATTGVSASQTRTTVTNSTIDRVNGDGVTVNSPVGVPTVTGNTVTNATGTAINIQSANIDMGLLNANSGSGNGLNGVQLANDTVTVSSALPWTGNLIPVLTSGCNALTVPAGVTLTLGAGTIIKGQYSGCAFLSVQGSLIGNGTAASPVTFTSWRDDTIGGDTNGDGSATGPVKGDWGGISASPAGAGNPDPTVNLDRVTLRYATTGVSASQTRTTVTNSTIDRVNGDGVTVNSPVGVPTVTGNTVTNATGTAINIQSANIDMGLLNANSGSGNGLNGVQLANDTVTVSSALPWTGNLIPVLTSGCNALTVPAGVTLTLGAGTIIKGQYSGCAFLSVQGSLIGNGTAASPVTFTSWRDDTIGGDTNGDANATAAAANDWGGITVADTATASLQGTTLRFASTALSVAAGGDATIHGAILDSTVGVSASSYVDATGVDWGHPSGPSPNGTGTLIQGSDVVVQPWVGYVPPPQPPAPPLEPLPPPDSAKCREILFIGARGSGEAPTNHPDGYSDPPFEINNMGQKINQVALGVEKRIDDLFPGAAQPRMRMLSLRYPAAEANGWNLASFTFFNSYWDGVYELERMLRREKNDCPDEKVILSGYSQGALVIHLALNDLAGSSQIATSRIGAVALLADPALIRDQAETLVGIDGLEEHARGVWTLWYFDVPMPSSLSDRTTSMCRKFDIVCAPGRGADTPTHTGGYSSANLEALGAYAADDTVLALPDF